MGDIIVCESSIWLLRCQELLHAIRANWMQAIVRRDNYQMEHVKMSRYNDLMGIAVNQKLTDVWYKLEWNWTFKAELGPNLYALRQAETQNLWQYMPTKLVIHWVASARFKTTTWYYVIKLVVGRRNTVVACSAAYQLSILHWLTTVNS